MAALKEFYSEDLEHKQFIDERLGEGWIWCLHCERVYKREDKRWDVKQGLYLCAY